ncbi:MAG TPA: LLM class flavin-dependent oxidoreductase [Alphaproteobacteria bacterium]|nr:LLM class flavin-dependent oxidoreductase [Alphaproteobacteria bacterium]
MKLGMFMMPNHPRHRTYADAHAHDLDTLIFADRLGYVEGWVGEHFTSKREPVPCPDILIAQALVKTERIRLGAGAFLLPYHVPAELAARISYLDHISGGRFMAGIGAGGLPTDYELFGVDGAHGEHREMMNESIDLIVKLWTSTGSFEHQGKHYKGGRTEGFPKLGLGFHLQPLTKPHPTVAIAGLNEYSPTLKFAGKRGFIPMSLAWSPDYLLTHWQAYKEGCDSVGRAPDRAEWRVGVETYIAETDAEARRRAINGEIGTSWRTYLLPMLKEWGMLGTCKHDQSVADSDVTVEYLVDKVWIVGSPKTVTEKLDAMRRKVGQFGCLLQVIYDHLEEFDAYRWSLTALAQEVLPNFAEPERAAAE